MGAVAVSSLVDWSAMAEMVGGVLDAVTVSRKLVGVEVWPSLTATVMVAEPVWLGAGVTVTVRLAPLPPKAMLARGTRVVLDELPVSVRLAAGVSAAAVVEQRGPERAPGAWAWLAMAERVGA